MSTERTLSIIKPDAVAKNVIGEIYSRFEQDGLRIVAAKRLKLSEELAGGFYAEHKDRPFFADLIKFAFVGAPFDPGFLIFSPEPAAILFFFACMFAYNPRLAIIFFPSFSS